MAAILSQSTSDHKKHSYDKLLNLIFLSLYFSKKKSCTTILTEGEISQNLVLLIQAEVELELVLLPGHSVVQNTVKETQPLQILHCLRKKYTACYCKLSKH